MSIHTFYGEGSAETVRLSTLILWQIQKKRQTSEAELQGHACQDRITPNT